MARRRLLSNKEVRRIALICSADRLDMLAYGSEHEDGIVLARGGSEYDTEAVLRQMRRIAKQLRQRVEKKEEWDD